MHKGGVTQPVFQSLEAFWPGMLSLVGEIEGASAIMKNYYTIWKQFGFTPEFFDVARGLPMSKREGYPLRPGMLGVVVGRTDIASVVDCIEYEYELGDGMSGVGT